jgi:catechol 2,3-dioxygenase-like lactoylglutathione lyase family enzyme
MKKLTPNLIVKSIEDCLPFWVERLGFTKTVEVPDGPRLGFAILQRGEIELMLQTRASLVKDVPGIAGDPDTAGAVSGVLLYFDVPDIGAIRDALADWPRVALERTTFYGAREIIVRDPDDHVLFFAAHTGEV